MTSEEKVEEFERQVLAIRDGQSTSLDCPFCHLHTEFGQVICCEHAADCASAIVNHLESKGALEVLEQVMDKAQRN